MFPVLKYLVNYFTGSGQDVLSTSSDVDEISSSESDPGDNRILTTKKREKLKKSKESESDSCTVERLTEEIRIIEGWQEKVKNINESSIPLEGTNEENYSDESRLQNNKEDNCDGVSLVNVNDENKFESSSEVGPELCEHRVGTITELRREFGVIDDKLQFCHETFKIRNLREGVSVNYVVFRRTVEEEWQIHKILSITDENWEESKETKTEVLKKSGAIDRKMIGQVECRNGREVFVKPNIKFCIDDVASDFIPYKGDWLSISALVELDASIQDFVGEVLSVHGFEPVRSKVIFGVVTDWDTNKQTGVIDKNIWFTQNECEPGFLPSLNDTVALQAIESTQEAYTWRAISVVCLSERKKGLAENQPITEEKDKEKNSMWIKNGISIPRNIDFGLVTFGETKEHTIEVSNRGKNHHILLRGRFHGKKSESQIQLLSRIDDGTYVGPGQTIHCRFRICGKFLGQSTEVFVFSFKGFKMTCFIDVEVHDTAVSQLISHDNRGPKHPRNVSYAAARKMQFVSKNELTMRGVQPIKPPAFVPVKFGTYSVPESLWKAVLGEDNSDLSSTKIISRLAEVEQCLNNELTINNYCARFHALLHIEEIDMNIEIHKYDLECVTLSVVGGEYLSLEVPGLAEKRPSVMIGDRINLFCSVRPGYKYEGFIHKVCANEVWLKFHNQFHQTYASEECSVHFTVSRGPLKRCHIAVDLALKHLGDHVLFPKCLKIKEPQVKIVEGSGENSTSGASDSHYTNRSSSRRLQLASFQRRNKILQSNGAPNYLEIGKQYLPLLPAPKISKEPVRLKWFNPGLNYYQKEAVRNALKGEARALPYVIFGPPGTGKTITLVETILQIYSLIPDSRILVATPSNSSANLIAERLLHSKQLCPGDLVRLVAYHCLEEGTVPEILLPYSTTCDINGAGGHSAVTYKLKMSSNASVLGRHRITVGTCIALGQLYVMGFPSGHFTHVCVDEAGQATEPEILIPMGFLHKDWGQAILAGDPLQLGPVVNSRASLHFGLGHSYLARLLESCPYRRDPCSFSSSGGYNPKLITRLVMNYRSLPEILRLPNELFYDSQLQPQVNDTGFEGSIVKSLVQFLPNRDTPMPPSVVFHGVRGVNFQDSDCPSWFNPQELVQIMYYLKDFFDSGLKPDDIGVITPYQKQVQKLRSLLTQLELPSPKIGSVEEFQGQERFVIILSTVRSNSKYIKTDLRYTLGFVASPQRLNVALTRARALLIIIGNPHLLSQDTHWRKTLAYCIDNNAYVGCDVPREFINFTHENDLKSANN